MRKLLALTTGLLLSGALAAGTPAGTTITNTAYLDALNPDGSPITPVESNPVTLTVKAVPAILITPDTNPAHPNGFGQTVVGVPGQNAALTYTLTNPGNSPDTYTLSVLGTTADTTAANATLYADTNGDGVYGGGDTLITAPVALAADQKMTFFVVYPVPAGALATNLYGLNPQGTSGLSVTNTPDAPVTDKNNIGGIVVKNMMSLTLTKDETGEVSSPGTITYTHTLTNTGNTDLTGANTNLAVGTQAGGWAYSYVVGDGTAATTPQKALENWGQPLTPGKTAEVKVTVTAPAGLAGGTTDKTSISAVITTADSATVDNATETPIQVADTTTVARGEGSVAKSVLSCGTDTTCAAPTAIPTSNVVPGEIIQYTVGASNVGNGGLQKAVLRDTLPASLLGVSWTGTATGVTGGKLIYSLNGTDWANLPQNIADVEGVTLYLGYDSNGDNTMTSADLLPASAKLNLTLTAKVK
ncbi:hypothetical protein [Deinococcus sp.]|uniref:hypothetical protein n=1 Tax=Deinococcus sp. TaxID=47478 RepID=UPI0025C23F0B|nr:hypothetical protein [Deinococcus sp.]